MALSILSKALLRTIRVAALGLTGLFTAWAFATPAQAQGLSEASAASALSVGVPVMLASASATVLQDGLELLVTSVEASADGTVWLLEGAIEGGSVALATAYDAATLSAVAVGSVMTAVTIHGGWLLMQGNMPVALVPDATGAALLHHERIEQ